ncbi:MAG: AAA family ATPase [Proteobacteria bacterium]|nr:AAA family ATPase [Pseudomonadota bacterium]
MYLDHYGLREPPFSITPDPRFVFLSERHRDALAHLLYGIGQGGGSGFVQLTGEVGTGKTTLSRLLLEQLPDNARVALILNPLLSPAELLEAICEELRIDLDGRRGNLKALVDALNAHLLAAHAAGLRVVAIIDEAQNLSPAALEQVRLLTNLETPTQKLLQIILLGQPELRDMLARPDLRQLAQRITARYHLAPLDAHESDAYLRHRWAVAGGAAFPFTPAAIKRLHRHAGGVPRLLNVIAERALLAGYARGTRSIDENLLEQAAREVLAPPARTKHWPRTTAIVLATLALAGLGIDSLHRWWSAPARAPAAPPARTAARTAPIPASSLASAARRLASVPDVRKGSDAATAASPLDAAPLLDAAQFTQRIDGGPGDAAGAWRELLALWAIRPDPSLDAMVSSCPAKQRPGLFCASGKQRLSLLAQFDRPLLLRLRHEGHAAWAILLGLGSSHALLRINDHDVQVRRAVLEAALDGYAAAGRGPEAVALPIKPGDSGPGIAWLRRQLNATAATAGDGNTYSGPLVEAVRSRQRDLGLRADGVVGPETLLALLATDRDGPHLRKLPE